MSYQPKTGEPCSCRPGVERDNCPRCEGTGQRIDFRAIRMRSEHEEKYERLAQWLGVRALVKLVPFSKEHVQAALSSGDEHLNTLPLHMWDRQHGVEPEALRPQVCQCCKQLIPPPVQGTAMVWGLVRAAIRRDRAAEHEPLVLAWSLSDTVCVLKHVAKFHL